MKMKIAVASKKNMGTEHFDHYENFSIFEVENNEIIKSESIKNTVHKHHDDCGHKNRCIYE